MPEIEEPLSLRLLGALMSAGFSPEAPDDGLITYQCEGYAICMMASEDDDPEYAYAWIDIDRDNSSAARRVAALDIANDFNSRWKVIKVTVSDTEFSVYGEAFILPMGDLAPLLSRLSHAVATVASELRRSA